MLGYSFLGPDAESSDEEDMRDQTSIGDEIFP